MTRAPLVCTLLLLTLSVGCSNNDGAPAEASIVAEVAATVEPVGTQDFDESIEAVGTVTPRTGQVASLAAPAPARVAKVFVTAGSTVRAGDPLIEFEHAPFDAAAASAESALQTAEQAADRTKRLAEAGVLPRKDAEAAAAELSSARSNAIAARRIRDLTTLRAPISGAVTRISAVLGANVDPSQQLVDVANVRALDVVLTVSPADASRARAGQRVTIYAGSTASGDPIATGRIGEVAAVVDSASGGVMLRVALAETKRMMRISEVVMGRVAVAHHANAITVPDAALVPTGEAFQVFVVDSAQVAHATPVTIGGRSNGVVWISSGLEGGERVVTKGAFGIDDGSTIVSAKP
ncbi:MAG: efflux RND transporter periplasmic adaptor subunit [Gemmatimonadota bacterium]